MDTLILHDAGSAGTQEIIPASVRALDAALNQRVQRATSEHALNACLRQKQSIKRAIADLPTAAIASAARSILDQLTTSEALIAVHEGADADQIPSDAARRAGLRESAKRELAAVPSAQLDPAVPALPPAIGGR